MTTLILGDRVLDFGLGDLDTLATHIYVCRARPTTYLEAITSPATSPDNGYALGSKSFGAGSVFGSPFTSSPDIGRDITSLAVTGGSITASGTVLYWAVVDSVNTRLLATGPLTATGSPAGGDVTSGQTFTLDAFTIRMPSAAAAASGFTANAVTFDGATTFSHRGTIATAPAASKVGLVSFWFQPNGGDGNFQCILESDSGVLIQVLRMNTNVIRVFGSGGIGLNFSTTTAFTAGGAWRHVIAGWDSSISRTQVYVDGVSDIAGGATITADATSNYANETSWNFGSVEGGTLIPDANIAEFYCNLAETLDLSDSAQVQKFRTVGGKPVDLGATGATPTGTAPLIYFKNAAASYDTNSGTGGDFVLTGSLGTPTSPSV